MKTVKQRFEERSKMYWAAALVYKQRGDLSEYQRLSRLSVQCQYLADIR